MPVFDLQAERCPGCDQALAAAGQWCPRCGNPPARRLDAGQVMGEWLDQLASFDFPLWHTLRALIRRPGDFLQRYLRGGRVGIATPVRFFIIWVSLEVAITLAMGWFGQTGLADRQAADKLGIDPERIASFAYGLRAYLGLLIMLPVAAVASRLWSASGLRVGEAYAVLLYASALAALCQLLLGGLLGGVLGIAPSPLWRLACLGLAELYLFRALTRQSLVASLWRVCLLQLLYVPLSALIVLPLFLLTQAY